MIKLPSYKAEIDNLSSPPKQRKIVSWRHVKYSINYYVTVPDFTTWGLFCEIVIFIISFKISDYSAFILILKFILPLNTQIRVIIILFIHTSVIGILL